MKSYGQTVLFVGDLAYQDTYPFHYQVRFDTWSRFVERSAAYQPWIWTTGNHEIDFLPHIVSITMHCPLSHNTNHNINYNMCSEFHVWQLDGLSHSRSSEAHIRVVVVVQGEITPFKPFNHRFPTPHDASSSSSPQWYAIKRGPVHIIVLSSYSAYGIYLHPQDATFQPFDLLFQRACKKQFDDLSNVMR